MPKLCGRFQRNNNCTKKKFQHSIYDIVCNVENIIAFSNNQQESKLIIEFTILCVLLILVEEKRWFSCEIVLNNFKKTNVRSPVLHITIPRCDHFAIFGAAAPHSHWRHKNISLHKQWLGMVDRRTSKILDHCNSRCYCPSRIYSFREKF